MASITPDASNYEIQEVSEVGTHLVLKVKYPNCASCAYEGNKVMVFLNVKAIDAMKWKKIDPHFRAPPKVGSSYPNITSREAPSPAARFPGSADGWADAIAYAMGKQRIKEELHTR